MSPPRSPCLSLLLCVLFVVAAGIAPGREEQEPRASNSPPPAEARGRKGGSDSKDPSPQDDAGRTGAEESVFLSCNTTRTPVFSCGEGACIPYDLRCNGVSDCANDADEAVRECDDIED
ncbi:modular serine protease-like [Penaeus chinensis]|uniref:modular serine protease-like n=1 Tax=Penaeus chinensis TaxID=139456 RepID=UPI001FB68018|nr:modular serine protease-like [Penaeus chinensis]